MDRRRSRNGGIAFGRCPGLAILAGVTGGPWRRLRRTPAPPGDDKFQVLKPACEPKSASAPFTFSTALYLENPELDEGLGRRMAPSVATIHFN